MGKHQSVDHCQHGRGVSSSRRLGMRPDIVRGIESRKWVQVDSSPSLPRRMLSLHRIEAHVAEMSEETETHATEKE
jgi:hypothetical protein